MPSYSIHYLNSSVQRPRPNSVSWREQRNNEKCCSSIEDKYYFPRGESKHDERRGSTVCNCSKDSFVAVRLARGVGRDRCPSRIKVKATLRDFLERGKHVRGRQIKDVSAFYEILMSKRVCWASRGSCSATAAAPGSAKRDPARWPPFYKTRCARWPSKVGKNLHPRDNHAGKSLKSHPSRTEPFQGPKSPNGSWNF